MRPTTTITTDPASDATGGGASSADDGTSSTADCTTETIEDEYGFVVEVQICDGVVVDEVDLPLEESLADLDSLPGSVAGAVLAAGLRDRLVLQTGCAAPAPTVALDGLDVLADPGAVGDAIRLVPDGAAQAALIDAFAAVTAADTACNADPAAWRAETRRALVALESFGSMIGAEPAAVDPAVAPPTDADDPTVLSATVANLYDRLYQALTDALPIQGSDLWFSSSHFAHVSGLRTLVAGGASAGALVLGSSLVARGVDPNEVADVSGRNVVSFALTGATQPVHIALAEEARRIDPGIDTILWGQGTHPFFRECVTEDLARIEAPLSLQRAAFSPIDGLGARLPVDRLLGDPAGPASYGDSPLAHSARQLHGDWSRGATAAFEGQDPDRKAEQLTTFETVYLNPVLCEDLLGLVDQTIARWTGEGIDVVVFVPPSSDEMTAIHPDGRAGHDAVVDRLREVATSHGAGFADLSDLVDDADFYDLTHVNAIGRASLSSELAKVLGSR